MTADLGDDAGTWVVQITQGEISRLMRERAIPTLLGSMQGSLSPAADKGAPGVSDVVDGASALADRSEFERVLREGAHAMGMSVEDSAWEARTVTDMLADLGESVRAEIAARGHASPPWSVDVINGRFRDSDTIVRVVLRGPGEDEAEASEILALCAQRVSSRNQFERLTVSREVLRHAREQLALMPEEFPLRVGQPRNSSFVELSFPRSKRSQVELAVRAAAVAELGGEAGDVMSVKIPAEAIKTLVREGHMSVRGQDGGWDAGDLEPSRTPAPESGDGLYRPVLVVDANARGAETAEIMVAARDQGRLLRDVIALGIRDPRGRAIDALARVSPNVDAVVDPFDRAAHDAREAAARIGDASHDHPSLTDRSMG